MNSAKNLRPLSGALILLVMLALAAGPAIAQPQLPAPALSGPAQHTAPLEALSAPMVGGAWQDQGPGPTQFGQVENITPDDEVVGAIHTVLADPKAAGRLFVGAVNGGVWMTNNATSNNPKWKRLTDDQLSQSIGALAFDPGDPARKTLVAGIGLFSSFGRAGGARLGLLRTTDRGTTWELINGGGILVNKNISGVASRGTTLVASVNIADPFTFGNIGIWRSTDDGASFQQIAVGNGAATGLPGGVTYDLVEDPNRPERLFTSVVFADLVGGANGIYRSDDTGATWTKVSNPAIDALLISGVTSNVEFAVGQHDNVYAAIANSGRLAGVFRSGDGGATWTSLGLPLTDEGSPIGIHPGGQASIHMSIVADPGDPNLVYIGGDRQPLFNEQIAAPNSFPNSLGAVDFSGRLFRGDASQPAGSVWAHLTHVPTASVPSGGTASGSSPHADSREMAFDKQGNLIEVDDGGIYKRTSPRDNTGDWISLNGDIQTTEFHDASFDTNSNTVIGGAQDTGTPVQIFPNDPAWQSLLTADGGDTAVNTTTFPGLSIRYSSFQNLASFNRTVWDANNNFLSFTFPALQVVAGAPLQRQFTTPVELNRADPTRLIIGGANAPYESLDEGTTLVEVTAGIPVNGSGTDPIGYGAADNPDILYIGSGDRVYVRTTAYPAPLVRSLTYPGDSSGFAVRDIVVDPEDGDTAYVINSIGVFRTTDAGATWSDITGNLGSLAFTPLRSITLVTGGSEDAVVVGAVNSVFIAGASSGFTSYARLGSGLPTVPTYDLDYDPARDVLMAGTLGRGAWTLGGIRATAIPALSGQ